MQTSLCKIKLRRGTDENRLKVTPEQGEPVYSYDAHRLAIGDGIAVGGNPITNVWSVSANNSTGNIESTEVSYETYTGDILIRQYVTVENNGQGEEIITANPKDAQVIIQTDVANNINGNDSDVLIIGGKGSVNANYPLYIASDNRHTTVALDYNNEGKYVQLSAIESVIDGGVGIKTPLYINQTNLETKITSIDSQITTLSAHRIYSNISPIMVGYTAISAIQEDNGDKDNPDYVYELTNSEYPLTNFANSIQFSNLSGNIGSIKINDETQYYGIERGIKLFYSDTLEASSLKTVVLTSNDVEVTPTAVEIPHLTVSQKYTNNILNTKTSAFTNIFADMKTASSVLSDNLTNDVVHYADFNSAESINLTADYTLSKNGLFVATIGMSAQTDNTSEIYLKVNDANTAYMLPSLPANNGHVYILPISCALKAGDKIAWSTPPTCTYASILYLLN